MTGRRISIFTKLFFSFLLLIVPLSLLSLMLNRYGQSAIRSELLATASHSAAYYVAEFENEINRIIDSERQLTLDEDIQIISLIPETLSDFAWTRAVNRIQNKMILIKNSSSYIGNVRIVVPGSDLIIYRDNVTRLGEEVAVYQDAPPATGLIQKSGTSGLLLSQSYPYSASDGRLPKLIVEIELSESSVRGALRTMVANQTGGALLVSGDRSWHISTFSADETRNLFQGLDARKASQRGESVQLNDRSYLYLEHDNPELGVALYNFVPKDRIFKPLHRFTVWFWVLFAGSMLVIGIFSFMMYRFIHAPLRYLVKAFQRLEKADFDIAIHHSNRDEFGYLYQQFNKTVARLGMMVEENFVQKIKLQSMQLKQLQAQINPHFLYNSLFILKRMITSKQTGLSVRFVEHLGEYFQFLNRYTADDISLKLEFSHAMNYANIQLIRFSGRMELVLVDIPDPLPEAPVPRLTIQPIIENAFLHGLRNKLGKGKVEARYEETPDAFIISVEDNGEDLTDDTLERLREKLGDVEHSSGMANVHRRLAIKYGGNCGLALSRSDLGGLKVDIIFGKGRPLHEAASDR